MINILLSKEEKLFNSLRSTGLYQNIIFDYKSIRFNYRYYQIDIRFDNTYIYVDCSKNGRSVEDYLCWSNKESILSRIEEMCKWIEDKEEWNRITQEISDRKILEIESIISEDDIRDILLEISDMSINYNIVGPRENINWDIHHFGVSYSQESMYEDIYSELKSKYKIIFSPPNTLRKQGEFMIKLSDAILRLKSGYDVDVTYQNINSQITLWIKLS